jgi:hypothetical protein
MDAGQASWHTEAFMLGMNDCACAKVQKTTLFSATAALVGNASIYVHTKAWVLWNSPCALILVSLTGLHGCVPACIHPRMHALMSSAG